MRAHRIILLGDQFSSSLDLAEKYNVFQLSATKPLEKMAVIERLAHGILVAFTQISVPEQKDILELVQLAQMNHFGINETILNILFESIKKQMEPGYCLNPNFVFGLIEVIRQLSTEFLNGKIQELLEIVKTMAFWLRARIAVPQEFEKWCAVLIAITEILDVLVDNVVLKAIGLEHQSLFRLDFSELEVGGSDSLIKLLSEKTTLEARLEVVAHYFKSLSFNKGTGITQALKADLENALSVHERHPDPSVRYWIHYALQALARIPGDQEALLNRYSRRGMSLMLTGKNIALLYATQGSAVAEYRSLVKNMIGIFRDPVMMNQERWYDSAREIRTLMQTSMSIASDDLSFLLEQLDSVLVSHKKSWEISLFILLQCESIFLSEKEDNTEVQWVDWTFELFRNKEKRYSDHALVRQTALDVLIRVAQHPSETIRVVAQDRLKALYETYVDKFPSKAGVVIRSQRKDILQVLRDPKIRPPSVDPKIPGTQLLEAAWETGFKVDRFIQKTRVVLSEWREKTGVESDLNDCIPLQGSLGEYASSQKELFPLKERVLDFVADPNPQRKILILHGESGSGKSLFGRYLERYYWNGYGASSEIIPLFLELSMLTDPTKDGIEQTLWKMGWSREAVEELKCEKRPLLVLIDGYDLLPQSMDLLRNHGLVSPWNSRVIILVRTECVASLEHALFTSCKAAQWFVPEKIKIAPLQDDQVNRYIQDHRPRDAVALIHRSEMRTLILQPLLLKMALSLPVTESEKEGLTRAEFYRLVLNGRFVHEVDRLCQRSLAAGPIGYDSPDDFLALSKRIAQHMLRTKCDYLEEDPSDPQYLRDAEFFDDQNQGICLARSGFPLQRVVGTHRWTFTYPSIYEYYVALSLYEEQERRIKKGLLLTGEALLNHCVLRDKPEIVRFYLDLMGARSLLGGRADAQVALYEVVLQSRGDASLALASANAMTLLVAARFSFSGRDLSRVRIPGALLDFGIFYGTNFSGANLSNVSAKCALLRGANLENCSLDGLRFGQYHFFGNDLIVHTAFLENRGQWLIIEASGDFSLWDANRSVNVGTWNFGAVKLAALDTVNQRCVFLSATLSEGGESILHKWTIGEESLFSTQSVVSASVITHLAVDGSNDFLALGDREGAVSFYRLSTGEKQGSLTAYSQEIKSLAFHPARSLLAIAGTGFETGYVQVWNWEQETDELREIYDAQVWSVAFHPEGELLAIGVGKPQKEGEIILWDLTHKTIHHVLRAGHAHVVTSLTFSLDGQWLMSGDRNRTLRLWELSSQALVEQQWTGEGGVTGIVFDERAEHVAVSSFGSTRVLFLETRSSPLLSAFSQKPHHGPVLSVLWSQTLDVFVTGGFDGSVHAWNAQSGLLWKPPTFWGVPIRSLCWEGDEATLLRVSAEDGRRVDTVFALSPDGQTKAVGDRHGGISVWDIGTNTEWVRFPVVHQGAITSLTYHPHNRWLASGGEDTTVMVWDMTSKTLYGRPLQGHRSQVVALAFCPRPEKRELLVSASWDGSIRLWNVKTTDLLLVIGGYYLDLAGITLGLPSCAAALEHFIRQCHDSADCTELARAAVLKFLQDYLETEDSSIQTFRDADLTESKIQLTLRLMGEVQKTSHGRTLQLRLQEALLENQEIEQKMRKSYGFFSSSRLSKQLKKAVKIVEGDCAPRMSQKLFL